mmetsp:Transcript_17763/g.44402  ORF Transcript_17763/g.44402 Transcript_17763/m.44402 type:complete len:314 (+) Transcript_17763:751-1692(+)|eukprot:CAMPEP_0178988768 /NCGR_PEP_ID=MMETSP0795-20121207/3986_1 /TAXON_ID=88552 /ORGANISM="Amoebophrya sp., Strain Ameob2" /LENGTH=313 /DNA_ID=CAMNT_0020680063 /DNA_START=721 /DNA_END=1662 /DNA_ORIENTATION=+
MADAASCGGEASPSQRYEKVEVKLLGEGTYGEVFKVKDNVTNEILAMKKMKLHDEEEGIPSTAIREISILKELPHVNVVHLRDVFCTQKKVMLVFEFVESDLKKYMKKQGGALSAAQVRDFGHQLLAGLDFCHNHRILHRDLKPQNLLVTTDREPVLKIADFGLARAFTLPIPKYTHEVVTVWYRAPEILLGQAEYALPVDIWSTGCIIGEMGCGAALFMGDCEIDTIFKIMQKMGTPNYEEWSGLQHLKDFKPETFPRWRKKSWVDIRELGNKVGPNCCDLLEHLMKYDPARRLSAKRALCHPFFLEGNNMR